MSYTPAKRSPAAAPATSQSNTLINLLKKSEGEIKRALPRHLNADRMIRILMTEVRLNPKLTECTPESFLGAAIQSAQLGLEPGNGLGQCYLVPRRNNKIDGFEVQFMIGYQGMVELAERDGRVTVEAHVIRERDHFEFKLGINPDIDHRPYWGPGGAGDVIGAYAVARYKDGRYKFRVITKEEIDAARKNSDGGNSPYSPWTRHYAEMARKTAVRRLFKMLPKSPEMARVQYLEDKLEAGESQDFSDLDVVTIELEQPKMEEVPEAVESQA